MSDKYCLLPGGNQNQIPEMVKRLISRKVRFSLHVRINKNNGLGFLFQILASDISKLPSDTSPFIECGFERGYSIFNMHNIDIENFLEKGQV